MLPSFTNKRLKSVFALSGGTAWAVGEQGALFMYNGTVWQPQTLATQQNLNSIYFTDSIHGWIVGDSGLIFRYNGMEWLQDTTGYINNLYSIFPVDSAYGFAGGDNGLVLQYVKPQPAPPPMVRKFCEYGNTWFVYHPEGDSYTYQWQVDMGSGFENLADDLIYSGVNGDSLSIASIPPDFYGYKFRCIATYEGVDSVSEVEELKFVNRWMGTVSDEWENTANWSCGSLPGENTDVLIECGEIVLRSTASVRSLTVLPGVHIIIDDIGVLNILK
jgi:hypothetical protein